MRVSTYSESFGSISSVRTPFFHLRMFFYKYHSDVNMKLTNDGIQASTAPEVIVFSETEECKLPTTLQLSLFDHLATDSRTDVMHNGN